VATSDDQVAAQHAIEGAGTGIVEEVEVAKSVTDQATALNDAWRCWLNMLSRGSSSNS